MSAHVLLNVLIELRKRDKMRDLSSILSLFRNDISKFNKNRSMNVRFNARIYHITLKLIKNHHLLRSGIIDVIT